MSRGTSRSAGPYRFRTTLYNTIYDVMLARGWKETEDDLDWDFHWADKQWMCEVFDHVHLHDRQRVNHFRNYYELCRKDNLIKNLKRTKRQLEREGRQEEAAQYDFFPPSFVLPAEYGMFQEEFKRNPGAVWIMKPTGQCQGRGIFLFNKLQHIADWRKDPRFGANTNDQASVEAYVVQRYIDRPLLVGGRKFDMRIYALVTTFSPLTIWLYRSAFCRFTQQRFSMNLKEIGDRYIHLTNVAVQKTSANYNKQQGCKWSIRKLKVFLMSKFGEDAANKVFVEIQGVMVRALLSVQKVMINDKHCCELYGYDVLIDADLKVWLLEVNASPSLSAETSADYDLKYNLLQDMLNLVDIEGRRPPNSTEERSGGFDLIYKDGYIHPPSNATVGSNLGTRNDLAIPSEKIPKPASLLKTQSSEKELM
jgi:tubulin polyglutamylase TTLL9